MKNISLKTTLVVALITCLGVATTSAQSREKEPKKPPTFKELLKHMDTDEDGKLSKAEIKGPLAKDFKKVDINKDGYLTEEEFKKAPKPKRSKRPSHNN